MRILKEQCRKIYFLAYLSFNSIQSLCHSLEKCYQLCPLCHCHLRLMYILSTILCYVFIASVFLVSTFYLQQIFRLQYAFFIVKKIYRNLPIKTDALTNLLWWTRVYYAENYIFWDSVPHVAMDLKSGIGWYKINNSTSEVPGSNPASPTAILGSCSVLACYYQSRE